MEPEELIDEGSSVDPPLIIDAVRRFAELEKHKKELEAEIAVIKEEESGLEPALLNHFQKLCIQRINVDGITIFLHRRVFGLLKVEKEQLCKVMKRCGLGDFIQMTYNSNQFNGYISEKDKTGESLPPSLAKVVDIGEKFTIRSKK